MAESNWPPAFTVAEIREVCGPWSQKRLRRVLERAGVIDPTLGPPYMVDERDLKEHFPTIWRRLYERHVLGMTPADHEHR